MIKPTPVLCMNCQKPSAYMKMLNGRLFRVTGTFRIAGVYKKKGKVVAKEYGHYPSCKHLRGREVRILI